MTADETDRLQALRREGSDFEQLRVSPRKGSTLLARLAPFRVLGRSSQGWSYCTSALESYTYSARVAPFPTPQIDLRYVSIMRYVQHER